MTLTSRQTEVLTALSYGLTCKEIADALEITEETAKCHIRSIHQRLGVKRNAEAVAWGFRKGVLTADYDDRGDVG